MKIISKKTIYKYYKEKDEIVHSLMLLSIEDDKCRFKKIYDSSENVVEEVFDLMIETIFRYKSCLSLNLR